MTSADLWLPLLAEYGFPTMVTFYLLYRLEQKLEKVALAVERLPSKLYNLTDN